MHYGVHSSVVMGFLGLCQEEQLIYMLDGLVVALNVLLCRRWCLLVSCGVSRGNAMIEASRTTRDVGKAYVCIF